MIRRLKPVLFPLLYMALIVALLSPLYMYFSHDVEKLKSSYPHIHFTQDSDPTFTIEASRPKGWVNLRDISKFGRPF